MKLKDVIECYISGDWGNEAPTERENIAVSCIRGADIMPIRNYNFSEIPTRYISAVSLASKGLKEGDIVIEKSGGSPTQSTGRVVYVSKELLQEKQNIVCTNFCVAIRIKKKWDPYYIYNYLLHVYDLGVFFNYEGKTSGLKNLDTEKAFDSIPIKDIDIIDQKRVSTILSTIDEKVSVNNRIRIRLEQTARKYYDFFINNTRIQKNNWREVSLCELIERKISGDWGNEEISGAYNFRVSCVRGADMNDLTQLPTRYIKMKEDILLVDGDIVVEISGGSPTQSTGRSVLITEEVLDRFNNKVICSNFCRGLRFKKPLHGYFYYLVFKALYETGCFFNYEGKTSGLHNLDIDAFLDNRVCVPSDGELTNLSQEIKSLYSQISLLDTENLQLMKEREYILPLLISGQLSIKE